MKFDEQVLVDGTTVFPENKIIYIFGTGVDAETAYKKIKGDVKAFIDNYRYGKNNKFYDRPIISFDEYRKLRTDKDLIIIATYRFSREISEQLQNAGLVGAKDYYIWDDQYLFHEDENSEQFIRFMKNIWSPYQVKEVKGDAKVMIPFENRHDTAAVVYAYCGNYFAQKYNAKIEAYLRFGMRTDDKSPVIEKIYRAFNVNDWIDPALNQEQTQEADELINSLWEQLYTWEDWKNVYIYNIHFGTTMIRHFLRIYIPTFDLRDQKMYNFLKLAVRTIVFWYHYINDNNFKVVILGDGTNWDGYIRDIAIDKGIPAYAMSYVMRKLCGDFAMGEPYLYFDKMWEQLTEEEQKYGIKWAKKQIEERLCGSVAEVDITLKNRYAFGLPMKGKSVLQQNEKMKIVIFPHFFEEDTYWIGKQIFDDNNFAWLCHLGELSENTPDYDWYLKMHPRASRRDCIICDMIVRKYPKIKLIKEDVSPFQLKEEGVKYALTICGTIGQEYPAIGIPVIMGGENPYSCYSFTINPKTKEEYDDLIYHLNKLLDYIEIEDLYKFYALNYLYYNWNVVNFADFFETEELGLSYEILDGMGKEIGSWRYKVYMETWTEKRHKEIVGQIEEKIQKLDNWKPYVLYKKG